MTGPRTRYVWTGALALAMTGAVLVSASASAPISGITVSSAGSSSAAASGATSSDPRDEAGREPAGTGVQAGSAEQIGTEGVTVRQVLAVLDRAERRLGQRPSPGPRVAQAAAELGMLYTTYQAQRAALTEPEARSQVRIEPASAGSRPRAEDGDPSSVSFDEVAVAAMRLANLLDPTSPAALLEARPGAESSLRRSLRETVAAYSDSTAGYANGRIPADVLCPLSFAPGHMLRCDAAERLTALSAEFEKEFGYPIPLTDSYRPYSMQVAVQDTKPHLAAIPGTSNHGWGLAIDLDDPIAGGSSAEYVWLRLHAPDYGWDNPSWARLGGAKPEPWHFEFFAAGSIPNRAIDPSDVGTWAPAARTAGGGAGGPAVAPASHRAPDTAGAPSAAADRPSSDGQAADDGVGGSDGGAPASGGGSTPDAPARPAPSKPESPAPEEAKEPDAPADAELVDVVDDTVGLVDDTVGAVGGTVEGVVGGLVGGLTGTGGNTTGQS